MGGGQLGRGKLEVKGSGVSPSFLKVERTVWPRHKHSKQQEDAGDERIYP